MNTSFSPFVVYGPSKSGTTWLQRILDSHPDIRCHFQLQLFPFIQERGVVAVRSKVSYSKLTSPFSSVFRDKKAEREYWVRLRYFQKLRPTLASMTEELKGQFPKAEDQEYMDKLLHETYRAITPHFLQDDPDATVFGLKSTTDLDFFLTVFPEAKVISIIRDGRDVATSKRFHMQRRGAFYLGDEKSWWLKTLNGFLPTRLVVRTLQNKMGWFGKKHFNSYTNDDMKFSAAALEKFSSDWALTTRFILKHGKKHPNQFHFLRYEELKADPAGTIKSTLNFLGARSDEDAISGILKATDFKQLKGKDKDGFFRKGTTGDWMNYFSEADKELFKSCTGDLLTELGYEKDNNW